MEEKKQNLELKKHVGIIHCANRLTLLQRKLSNVLLYHAYNNLLSREKHEITIGEISKLINYCSHDYNSLKTAFKALMSTVIEWNLLKKENCENDSCMQELKKNGNVFSWHASSILASVSIKGSVCIYSYSPELRALLYTPEIYGKINLLVQSRFASTYSLALYENCVRYKKIGHTGWMSIEVFRKLMGVTDDKYKVFKDFKKRILDKSINEINKLSDISISAELKRECSRQIIALKFVLSDNKNFNSVALNQTCENQKGKNVLNIKPCNFSLHQLLKEQFFLSDQQIANLCCKYDEAYLLSKIDLVQASPSYKNKKIDNLAAYFLSAVKENFQHSTNMLSIQRSKTKNDALAKAQLKKEEESRLMELKLQYENYCNNKLDDVLKNMNAAMLSQIKNEFEDDLLKFPNFGSKKAIKHFKESGFSNTLVKAFFKQFLDNNYPNFSKEICAFKQFTENNLYLSHE